MEKRAVNRQRVLKSGTIQFGGATVDCTIRNLSSMGAMLIVDSPAGIPERFMLIVRTGHRRLLCRVVWHKEKQIGVVFT